MFLSKGTDDLELQLDATYPKSINVVSSSLGQSGIYSPPPLQHKWAAAQDLYKIESLSATKLETGDTGDGNNSSQDRISRESRHSSNASSRHSTASHSAAPHSIASHSVASHSAASHSAASRRGSAASVTHSIRSFHSNQGDKKHLNEDHNYSDNFDNGSASNGSASDGSRRSQMKTDTGINSLNGSLESLRPDSLRSDQTLPDTPKSFRSAVTPLQDTQELFHPAESKSVHSRSRESNTSVNSKFDATNTTDQQGKFQTENTHSLKSLSNGSRNNTPSNIINSQNIRDENLDTSVKSDISFPDLSQRTLSEKSRVNLVSGSSSHNYDDLLSKRSLVKNLSNTSKPVLSTHSPTTSRSHRNILRHSASTDNDLTHSVNLSGLSLNTNSEYDSINMDDLDRELGDSPFELKK